MSDLIQDLLNTYYGFGRENQPIRSLASHEGTIGQQNAFGNSDSTEYIVDDSEKNIINEEIHIDKASVVDNDVAGDESEEILVRSWRAISNNEDIDDVNKIINDKELILDTEEICKEIKSDNLKVGIDRISSLAKEETREGLTAPPASLGILEVLVQDNVPNVSSSMTLKKKIKKKPRSTTPASSASTQLPPLKFSSSAQKNPTYDETFFDMSNTCITEFPVHLLNEIHNIKMLYLEKNELEILPDELFINLNFLEWLDVRHNKLTSLPTTIKYHSSLQTILLQRNQFKRLPLELGLIPNLTGLQIKDNPLIYPPSNILSLGFTAIIKYLRKQWNADHPDEQLHPPEDVKSTLTILCDKLHSTQRSLTSTKIYNNSSSMSLPNLRKNNLSIREKSWNYKPSNRYNGNGMNATLEAKFQWISKAKEMLNKQAAILQKIKDRDVLKKWRQDRRNFDKSIKKALNRTGNDIPFGVDYTDIPFLKKQQQHDEKQINTPDKDIDTQMSEISMSLRQLKIDKQLGKLDATNELERLQNEVKKLSDLQRQICSLRNRNQTAMSIYNDADTDKHEIKYQPPPSIII